MLRGDIEPDERVNGAVDWSILTYYAGGVEPALHRHYGYTLKSFRAHRAELRNKGGMLIRNSTLNVASYAGEEVTVMFHGTDTRAAQLICCSQRFRPSETGLLGKGIYMTQTRQKAEGYRVRECLHVCSVYLW